MKELGLIQRNELIINPYAVGLKFYSVFLRLKNLNSKEELDLITFLVNHPFILWCGLVGGEWDIGINLVSKDITHFQTMLKEIKDRCGNNFIDMLSLENLTLTKYDNLLPKYRIDSGININLTKSDTSFQTYLKRPAARYDDTIFKPDKIDLLIIGMLAFNPIISIAYISKKINISFDTVKNRIISLIKNKVILAFNPLMTINKIGICVYIVLIETNNLQDEKKIEQYLSQHPSIAYALKTHGKWDWQLYVGGSNHYEFYSMLRELRSAFPETIRSYSILSVIRDYKFTFIPEGLKQMFLC